MADSGKPREMKETGGYVGRDQGYRFRRTRHGFSDRRMTILLKAPEEYVFGTTVFHIFFFLM